MYRNLSEITQRPTFETALTEEDLNYIYDGSFQGLLTLIHHGILLKESPDNIFIENKSQPDLFSENKKIATDPAKAERVVKTLSNKFDLSMMQNIYYAFLSIEENIEKNIYDYVKLSFDYGKNIEGFYANDSVLAVKNAYKKVLSEKHRFLGIVRFRLLKDGLYYSPIEPDNNITGLLITHFKKRLPDQNWLIHDVRRNIGAIHNNGAASLISIDNFDKNVLQEGENLDKNIFNEKEEEYQKLWKTFFRKIAIVERKNPKLQRQFIPARYWKYLTEKN
jgi:probable DNA metabolism protein